MERLQEDVFELLASVRSNLPLPLPETNQPITFPERVKYNPEDPYAALDAWFLMKRRACGVQYRKKNHVISQKKEWFEYYCHRSGNPRSSSKGIRSRKKNVKPVGCKHRIQISRVVKRAPPSGAGSKGAEAAPALVAPADATLHFWDISSSQPKHTFHVPGTEDDLYHISLDPAVLRVVKHLLRADTPPAKIHGRIADFFVEKGADGAARNAQVLSHGALVPKQKLICNIRSKMRSQRRPPALRSKVPPAPGIWDAAKAGAAGALKPDLSHIISRLTMPGAPQIEPPLQKFFLPTTSLNTHEHFGPAHELPSAPFQRFAYAPAAPGDAPDDEPSNILALTTDAQVAPLAASDARQAELALPLWHGFGAARSDE
eukprot:gnl/Chilomastix_cuspidata/3334.p1 GENE.gnl/Chilomastix_cuspidata/3334~~gnl/Chilomastix_cuspidata/3334.p1  ORF type:complete len:373 (+),score=155.11 gnl/Chilomastix_cuspidata/3334:74-1192(+)